MQKPLVLFLYLLCLCLGLGGCSSFPNLSKPSWFGKDKDKMEGLDAEQLYIKGKVKLDDHDFSNAVEFYEALQARYPFGTYAQQGLLDLAYAYYKKEETASATASADRFIKLYPTHPSADYAYYLKGLANFNSGKGMAQRYLPQDVSQRDPGASMQSFQDFSQLLQKFPDSKYAEDARLRMIFLRNVLAQHEINVANFYMNRDAYVAAANRARYVVENYQQSPAIPEALVIMAKAYKILKMEDLAQDALRVLERNYPAHPGVAEVRKTVAR